MGTSWGEGVPITEVSSLVMASVPLVTCNMMYPSNKEGTCLREVQKCRYEEIQRETGPLVHHFPMFLLTNFLSHTTQTHTHTHTLIHPHALMHTHTHTAVKIVRKIQ